ncbi:PTS fructose-like transporter subunit IIB [Oculatella sp. LEGE 06141]|uniref:PTS fructose-like transporter subunit IIB n=1 Tax=Oculatella sp. LEGE 06141 TaxID=1828648 RepID=UPI00187F3924|nr:PTS fructose-like transporter subunit IIB [Oculatella sp. LEGE 06141]MBE9181112.1 PTS fructose-like transporter subunit IIB [Oculatella sp. LEGE 06141]
MKSIVAVTACPTGIAHTYMAAEALKKVAPIMECSIKVETQGSEGTKNQLSDQDIAAADAVVIAADTHVDLSRFAGKPVYETSTSQAIRETKSVIAAALAEHSAGVAPTQPDRTPASAPVPQPIAEQPSTSPNQTTRLVGITACPTGIAHTFMAADALKKAAHDLGYSMKVETQGSVGSKNQLTDEDIAAADAVVIAADTHVDLSRFRGKRVYETSTQKALKDGKSAIRSALEMPPPQQGDYLQYVNQAKEQRSAKRTGPYKHLLTGVSYMLPIIVAGGLIIALSFAFGINPEEGTFGAALSQIGGAAAFSLIVPVLSGYIAYSIADRPGLAPGLIGGVLAVNLGMGFLGGIISGFLAGYVALFIRDKLQLPRNFEGLKPVLVIPLLSTLVVGLLMIYVFGTPVKAISDGLTGFLQNMTDANALFLGLILGGMMAIDMGGPVNKVAYTFAVGLLSSQIFGPMAAVMAAGMTPPLGASLATFLAKDRFTRDEQEAGKVAAVLGISFITEGAIPFAANDPIRVLPACIVGSAITGGLSMLFGCTLRAPHGGIFVLAIPGAVSNLLLYIVAIAIGTVVTTAALLLLKRRRPLVAEAASESTVAQA